MLPGLGLDDRIFHRLQLPGYDIRYLNWMDPLSPNEAMESYAKRMTDRIDTSRSIVLIGHSFGGVVAQEIAQLIPVQQIILISSIKSRKENRFLFRIIAPLGLHRLFSKCLVVRTFFIWAGLNGYRDAEQRHLLLDMYRQKSNRYLRWALKQLSLWKEKPLETTIIHLHGTRDVTFPIKRIRKPVIRVEGGWHFMVFQKPEELSQKILENIQSPAQT